MRLPTRRTLIWLLPLGVLAALGWQLLAGHLPGARPTQRASTLSPAEVRSSCLTALARNLGTAASAPNPSAPGWDGRRWTWTTAARVDGDTLRFACTVEADGRTIVRVLH